MLKGKKLPRLSGQPLRGRVVAITGGGAGIGAATAELLAHRGAVLWIGDVDEAAARGVASKIRDAGGQATALALDVTDDASLGAFLDRAESNGPLDVLINNAGVMWVGSFHDEATGSVERQIAVNLLGPITGTRLAVGRMLPRGRGHIITVASAAAKLSPAGEATYSATKFGIYGYLSAVRRELRGTGIAITVVMPAVVDTALAAGTATGGAALLSPQLIAEAIADSVAHRRFEVHVPRTVAVLDRVRTLAPQPVRDLFDRIFVPNQIRSADHRARADYERKYLG